MLGKAQHEILLRPHTFFGKLGEPRQPSSILSHENVALFLVFSIWLTAAHADRSNSEIFPAAATAADKIGWKDGCFVINGQPTYISLGEIDYARVSRELWRDRLWRAKQMGLKLHPIVRVLGCIGTQKKQWYFSDRRPQFCLTCYHEITKRDEAIDTDLCCRQVRRCWSWAATAPRAPGAGAIFGAGQFNPKSEVDRGDLTQSAGRECHSSGLTVFKNTPRPSSRHLGSASCAISSPPTSEFGLKPIKMRATEG